MFSFYSKLYSPKHLEEIGVDMIYTNQLPNHFLFISNKITECNKIINVVSIPKTITTSSGFRITVDDKILRDSIYTIILNENKFKTTSELKKFFNNLIDKITDASTSFNKMNFKYKNNTYLEVYDEFTASPIGHDVLILQSL